MARPTSIHLRALSARNTRGFLTIGAVSVPCLLGRSGLRHLKREGDGATPIGSFALERMMYRPGSPALPKSRFGGRALRVDDGWCDDPRSLAYNRLVRLPFAASHEKLWRNDHLYDVVITTSHNQRPRVRGAGSAIFFHLTGEKPFTQGCVAVKASDMRKVLSLCGRRARLVIWPPGGGPRGGRRLPTPP